MRRQARWPEDGGKVAAHDGVEARPLCGDGRQVAAVMTGQVKETKGGVLLLLVVVANTIKNCLHGVLVVHCNVGEVGVCIVGGR